MNCRPISRKEFKFNIVIESNIMRTIGNSDFTIKSQPMAREETIPNFKVNHIYYAINEHKLIAFKVLAIIFGGAYGHNRVEFKIVTAEDKFRILYADDYFFKHCFESIEDYREYQRTLNQDLEVERVYSCSMIQPFLNGNTPLKEIPNNNGNLLATLPIFKVDDNTNNVVERPSWFNALWIDSDGLHFISHAEKDEYFTYEECEQSVSIIDFEESEKPQKVEMTEVNISIKIPIYAKDEAERTIMALNTMAVVNE